jgi:hypothetical protein
MKNPEVVYEQLRHLVKDNVPQDFTIIENEGKIEVRTQKEAVINGQKKPYVDLLTVIAFTWMKPFVTNCPIPYEKCSKAKVVSTAPKNFPMRISNSFKT